MFAKSTLQSAAERSEAAGACLGCATPVRPSAKKGHVENLGEPPCRVMPRGRRRRNPFVREHRRAERMRGAKRNPLPRNTGNVEYCSKQPSEARRQQTRLVGGKPQRAVRGGAPTASLAFAALQGGKAAPCGFDAPRRLGEVDAK